MVANAASLFSKYAKAVCLVHVDAGIIFLFQADNLGQVSQVALHGEDTIYNNQFDSIGFALLQLLLQSLHVVVLVLQLGGKTQTSAIYNRSMVTVIADDVVTTSYQLGNHPLVNRKARREAECFILAYKLSQFFF